MPGKHGMTKNKKGIPKNYNGAPKKGFDFKSEKTKNKRNYNSKSAEQISEEVTMSALKGGMPKRTKAEAKADAIEGGFDKAKAEEVFAKMKNGMPKNYNGMTKNFAMKNKMLSDSAKNGVRMQKNFLGKVGKAMMGPAGMLLTKKPGSTQEKDENKKSTDTVVNPDTKVVTDVATQRLIKAGAPKEVIEKAKAKFIARETSKNKK